MTDIDRETYIVNRDSGMVHIAYGGRTHERCNVDQIRRKAEVLSLEEIGGVTRRKVRFCRWCRPVEEV